MSLSLAQIVDTMSTQIQEMSHQITQIQKIVEKNIQQQPGINPVLAKNLQRIRHNGALMTEMQSSLHEALNSLSAEEMTVTLSY